MRSPNRQFYFGLAKELKMTVGELLKKCDSQELAEWQAYYLTQDDKWVKHYNTNNTDGSDLQDQILKAFGKGNNK